MRSSLHTSPRVCFFAHFDTDGHVADYVFRYLHKLRDLDFTIVFTTTAVISAETKEALLEICYDVIVRENQGLDFGSWAEAYARYGHELTGDLLLANDSVYGPIGDLRGPLQELVRRDADFYGFVESLDTARHLQSWFLLFKPHVYRSRAFESVMALPFSRMSKREIIEGAEIGFSSTLTGAGFRYVAAYQPSASGLLPRLRPFNPSHVLWRELITDCRIPFIKAELLRANPAAVSDIEEWESVVRDIDPEIVPLVNSHLLRKQAALSPPQRQGIRAWFEKNWPLRPFVARDYAYTKSGRPIATVLNAAGFFAIAATRKVLITVLEQLMFTRAHHRRR
ncbi:rhamnan synthesis F family protein [Microvirga calopogonii]|uniref:rhamnan synthesis F family protein n=1 Tax=Microvirga calopogonii TaxID=2078013 RepID=UPI000E0D590D|nr:rhamnan synthesis F family protein [Microvirga calopogonii]